ncbi:proline dehydrogenase family protein [Comamonas sp. JC664]|uniref:proline dehydrogenase family protein n=1 Tax=Comamonas sp. JC664 TaxID=2801917 RepID=UPI001749AD96|nr:proline dehydrogenase family protein [Comamonas sp. JC664]MBL0692449.1 proline dehydrogenase family protein [Comamonas sp. JC664]GHH01263.1 proline dehydrogenase [Comamonas sp. KCTC 72670]
MTADTTHLSRAALLFLARKPALKDLATRLGPFRKLASRFIAGESLEEALDAVKALGAKGFMASFDHLNEAVQTPEEARAEVREYQRLLNRIDAVDVRANVSLKLTQCGLLFDAPLALENARAVVADAAARDSFVRIDMEDSSVTQVTLDIVRQLRAEFGEPHVGAVLQSALRRTEQDARDLCAQRIRIRLCKGAYLEKPDVAFPDKRDVDANFIRCMRVLLDSGVYHGIATHDERMIEATLDHATRRGLPRGAFEFQMLYGIRRDLQERLVREGHPVRIYVPYGRHWYPYFMRRLAERPANLGFLLRNLVRG